MFSLKETKKIEDWIYAFTNVFPLLGVNDDAQQVCLAALYLAEDFRVWYELHEDFDSFEALATALREQFQDVDEESDARKKLASLKQRAKDSMQSYIRHTRRLILKSTIAEDDELVLQLFINGIYDRDIRTRLVLENPDTIESAFKKALELSRALLLARGRSAPNATSTRTKLQTGEREKLMKEGKCFKCKQPGHRANACPVKAEGMAIAEDEEERDDDDLGEFDMLETSGNEVAW